MSDCMQFSYICSYIYPYKKLTLNELVTNDTHNEVCVLPVLSAVTSRINLQTM